MTLQCGQRVLSLDTPQIMGVLNVTPDSFSDGGQLLSNEGLLHDRLLERAVQMVADGAAILDIGGESTRPGAAPVSLQEELDRVMGAVQLIAPRLDVILSIASAVSSDIAFEGCAAVRPRNTSSPPSSYIRGPMASERPHLVTILRAISVAR